MSLDSYQVTYLFQPEIVRFVFPETMLYTLAVNILIIQIQLVIKCVVIFLIGTLVLANYAVVYSYSSFPSGKQAAYIVSSSHQLWLAVEYSILQLHMPHAHLNNHSECAQNTTQVHENMPLLHLYVSTVCYLRTLL